MKTGLVSVSFRSLSPEAVIDLAARAGLGSIEWGGDIHVPPHDLIRARRIGELTRAAGLEVACYGSYYRLTDDESGMAESIVAAAKALGAPMIRVWAGQLPSAEASEEYRAMIVRNAQRLADMADGIDIAFEYHGGTLTDDACSALDLLQTANRPNIAALWQPPVNMSVADCLSSIRTVGGYIRNIHVFSWRGTDRLPLAEGAEKWRACLAEIRNLPGEHRLMLEFVKDDSPDQLPADAATLKRWIKGEWNQ